MSWWGNILTFINNSLQFLGFDSRNCITFTIESYSFCFLRVFFFSPKHTTLNLEKNLVGIQEGLPWWLSSKESACSEGAAEDTGSIPRSGRLPWKRAEEPSAVLFPGESHGQRSLADTVHRVAKSQTQLKWLSTHTGTQETAGQALILSPRLTC